MPTEQAVRTVEDTDTLLSAFRRTVAERSGEVAVRAHDGSLVLTWGDLAERSAALAAGLAALGLGKGDTVALLLRNRPEFHPVDLAAVTIGAVTVSLYVTSAPPQLQHVISDAGASAVISDRGLVGAGFRRPRVRRGSSRPRSGSVPISAVLRTSSMRSNGVSPPGCPAAGRHGALLRGRSRAPGER